MLNKPRLPGKKPDNPHREDVNQRTMAMIAESRPEPDTLPVASEEVTETAIPEVQKKNSRSRPSNKSSQAPRGRSRTSEAIRVLVAIPTNTQTIDRIEALIASVPATKQQPLRRRIMARLAAEFSAEQARLQPAEGFSTQIYRATLRVPPEVVHLVTRRDDPKGIRPVSEVIGNAVAPYFHRFVNSL